MGEILKLLHRINDALCTLLANFSTNSQIENIGIHIDEGDEPTEGFKDRIVVPWDGVIVGWTVLEVSEEPEAGDVVFDILLTKYADYPTIGTSIVGDDPPELDSEVKRKSTNLDGWNTILSKGDILDFELSNPDNVEKIKLILHILKN